MAAIAERQIAERLLDEINSKEDLTLRLGDALDVKASIGLALIIFLATQSAYFLDKGLSRFGFWMQIASVLCIALAAFFAVYELWPRTYILPKPESDIIPARVKQLKEYFASYPESYPNVQENVADALINDEIGWATSRIADNQEKNWRKSNSLNLSFWATIPALALNIATLLTLIK